jgi:hypothetical protein
LVRAPGIVSNKIKPWPYLPLFFHLLGLLLFAAFIFGLRTFIAHCTPPIFSLLFVDPFLIAMNMAIELRIINTQTLFASALLAYPAF